MKTLRTTLFVIAFVILASQTFRHAYVRWMEPRTSVLDKYNTSTEKQILLAKSLDELVALFDAAHSKVQEYEKSHPEEADKQAYQRSGPYAQLTGDEVALRNSITEWERKSKEIRELWHFWIAGIIAFALGSFLVLTKERWIGMALLILAFTEMIYATSPSFRSMGSQPEFDRLLVHKFVLSVVSLGFLLIAWFSGRRTET
jgi:hypothetical protein